MTVALTAILLAFALAQARAGYSIPFAWPGYWITERKFVHYLCAAVWVVLAVRIIV